MPASASSNNSSDDKTSIYYNMFGSMTSGFFSRIPCHPLDTCKAKLQVQQTSLSSTGTTALKEISNIDPHAQSKYLPKLRNLPFGIGAFLSGNPSLYPSTTQPFKNTLDVLTKTLRREGVAGLYRGVTISAVGGCPAGCLYFTSYELTRRNLNKYEKFSNNSYLSDFIGGFMAEAVACILFVPIDIIKERMQVQSIIDPKFRYKSVSNAIQTMSKKEGIRGLYKAYGATLASFGPFSALYLMMYEQFKHLFVKYLNNDDIKDVKDLSSFYVATSACTAGAISALITNPLDMVKLRMQVQRGGIYNFGYKNIFHGLYTLVKYENFTAMFHGSGARVAFWVPNLAVNLTLYEYCTGFYRDNFNWD